MSALYLFGFYLLKFIVMILPDFLAKAMFKGVAIAYFKLNKKRYHTVMTNLNLAFGNSLNSDEKEKIAKECYIKFANYLGLNFIKNQNTTKEKLLSRIKFKNEKILQDALKSGRGVIVATAHYGEWESFSLAVAAKYGGVCVVGRRLDSSIMNAILSKNRKQFGIDIIEKSGAAKGILRALKLNKIVGILVDQNTARSEGLEVSFFGKRVLHTPAASILAYKSGALIVTAYIKSCDDGLSEICFYDTIDLAKLSKEFDKDSAILKATQLQALSCQRAIESAPSEYFWFHKRFKYFYEKEYEC